MLETLREIERIKAEMNRLVELALKRHPLLSDSRHYTKLLRLNCRLEQLYRELAYNEPTLYRSIMIANAIRSDIISGTHSKRDDEDHQGTA